MGMWATDEHGEGGAYRPLEERIFVPFRDSCVFTCAGKCDPAGLRQLCYHCATSPSHACGTSLLCVGKDAAVNCRLLATFADQKAHAQLVDRVDAERWEAQRNQRLSEAKARREKRQVLPTTAPSGSPAAVVVGARGGASRLTDKSEEGVAASRAAAELAAEEAAAALLRMDAQEKVAAARAHKAGSPRSKGAKGSENGGGNRGVRDEAGEKEADERGIGEESHDEGGEESGEERGAEGGDDEEELLLTSTVALKARVRQRERLQERARAQKAVADAARLRADERKRANQGAASSVSHTHAHARGRTHATARARTPVPAHVRSHLGRAPCACTMPERSRGDACARAGRVAPRCRGCGAGDGDPAQPDGGGEGSGAGERSGLGWQDERAWRGV